MVNVPQMQEVMLEFRAGRMFLQGIRVIPDTRKVLVRTLEGAGNLLDQNLASELASEATSAGPVQLADLQRILRNIQPAGVAQEQEGGLGHILKPDLVLPPIETLPSEQWLVSHLSEGSRSRDDLIELFQGPPFRQQAETFTHVLRAGQIDLFQFGIDPEALDDSVPKASESGNDEPSQDENQDSQSRRCSGSDVMDENWDCVCGTVLGYRTPDGSCLCFGGEEELGFLERVREPLLLKRFVHALQLASLVVLIIKTNGLPKQQVSSVH